MAHITIYRDTIGRPGWVTITGLDVSESEALVDGLHRAIGRIRDGHASVLAFEDDYTVEVI